MSSNRGLIRVALASKAKAKQMRESRWILARLTSTLISAFYRAVSLYLIGLDVPTSVRMGKRVVIHHGIGLVINDRAVIGSDVTLRHGTTIGSAAEDLPAPVIGDGVDVGSNVVIMGPIRIGEGAVIGAGSVVVHDVPPGATVVGNPARVLREVTIAGQDW